MKKFIRPIVAGFLAAATFFGVGGAMEITKRSFFGAQDQGGLFDTANAQVASGETNPVCFDNYTSWYNSTTRKTTADWSTWFVGPYIGPGSSTTQLRIYNNFERDINGDGLPDYMFVDHNNQSIGYWRMFDCVYLSNGHGWELGYRCVAVKTLNVLTFYGDCAQ
jgi:hypothetical protein